MERLPDIVESPAEVPRVPTASHPSSSKQMSRQSSMPVNLVRKVKQHTTPQVNPEEWLSNYALNTLEKPLEAFLLDPITILNSLGSNEREDEIGQLYGRIYEACLSYSAFLSILAGYDAERIATGAATLLQDMLIQQFPAYVPKEQVLSKNVEELETSVQSLSTQLTSQREKLDTAEKEIDDLKFYEKAKELQIEQLQKERAEAQQQYEKEAELRADVEKKLNKLSGKFSKLKSRLNMVTDTCSLFTRELEEKREVLKNMRAKLGTASYEAKTNYLTAQELTKKIEILNELIAKQETAITEANARTDDVKIKYAELKQQMTDVLSSQVTYDFKDAALQFAEKTHREKCNTYELRIREQTMENHFRQTRIEELEMTQSELSTFLDKANLTLASISRFDPNAHKDTKYYKKLLKKCRKDLAAKQDLCEKLELERTSNRQTTLLMQQELALVSSKLEKAKIVTNKTSEQNSEFTKDLRSERMTNESCAKELDKVKNENVVLQVKLQDACLTASIYEEKNVALAAKIDKIQQTALDKINEWKELLAAEVTLRESFMRKFAQEEMDHCKKTNQLSIVQYSLKSKMKEIEQLQETLKATSNKIQLAKVAQHEAEQARNESCAQADFSARQFEEAKSALSVRDLRYETKLKYAEEQLAAEAGKWQERLELAEMQFNELWGIAHDVSTHYLTEKDIRERGERYITEIETKLENYRDENSRFEELTNSLKERIEENLLTIHKLEQSEASLTTQLAATTGKYKHFKHVYTELLNRPRDEAEEQLKLAHEKIATFEERFAKIQAIKLSMMHREVQTEIKRRNRRLGTVIDMTYFEEEEHDKRIARARYVESLVSQQVQTELKQKALKHRKDQFDYLLNDDQVQTRSKRFLMNKELGQFLVSAHMTNSKSGETTRRAIDDKPIKSLSNNPSEKMARSFTYKHVKPEIPKLKLRPAANQTRFPDALKSSGRKKRHRSIGSQSDDAEAAPELNETSSNTFIEYVANNCEKSTEEESAFQTVDFQLSKRNSAQRNRYILQKLKTEQTTTNTTQQNTDRSSKTFYLTQAGAPAFEIQRALTRKYNLDVANEEEKSDYGSSRQNSRIIRHRKSCSMGDASKTTLNTSSGYIETGIKAHLK